MDCNQGPAREDVFSRLKIDEYHWCDTYTGTAQDLIAAGLVSADQLPGQPGRNKWMCTYYDGRPVSQGSNGRRDEWYVQIAAKGKGNFQVLIGVPEDIMRRRRATVPTNPSEGVWCALRVSPLGRQRSNAIVIPLPTASAEPVRQEGRRGRLPKCVASLRDARLAKQETALADVEDVESRQKQAAAAVLKHARLLSEGNLFRGLVVGVLLEGWEPEMYTVGDWGELAQSIGDLV